MIVTKLVSIEIDVEVEQADLINAIWTKEDAKKLIIDIDNLISDWRFTVDVLTEILDTLNYYQDEVNNNEAITEDFVNQLRLAMENFT